MAWFIIERMPPVSLRICGNKITSRMGRLVKHHQTVDADTLARRGGHPGFKGTDKILVQTVSLISSSPRSLCRSWSTNRCLWSTGSLNSEKALAISVPAQKSSKRSTTGVPSRRRANGLTETEKSVTRWGAQWPAQPFPQRQRRAGARQAFAAARRSSANASSKRAPRS